MKIFITGATGFIGKHLVKRLAGTDHELVCLVRETSKVGALEQHGVTLVKGDVTAKASVCAGMHGCDWVIHLANIFSFWERDPSLYRKVNVEGTRHVMECALEAEVAKVVHVSTALIYGKPKQCPFTEESPVGPQRFSEYARTKYLGDLIAWDLYEKKGLPLVVLFPGGVMGPGDDKASGRYVKDLIDRRLPATVLPESVLTLVHVDDVVEAIIRAAEKKDNLGEKYLIGAHRAKVRDTNKLISEIAGVPLPKIVLRDTPFLGKNALLATLFADFTGSEPLFGVSTDQVRTMRNGFQFDGSKAGRELGITYTPLRKIYEDTIASYTSKRSA